MTSLIKILSVTYTSVMFIGFIPFASGTWASIFAALIFFLLLSSQHLLIQLAIILLCSIVAIWCSNLVIQNKTDDPHSIVIDEVIGMWITCLFIPSESLFWLFTAFIFFRALDIIKPWPIKNLEKLPGGAGIVSDDIVAGIIGLLLLLLIRAIL
jgi:phosphatidylglycerophosphatase A